ncbi:hypothetical protein KKA69_04660 [Patescibacteria group bacterium]|nr:hypothetical protein [Patescibacteria group bacterium]
MLTNKGDNQYLASTEIIYINIGGYMKNNSRIRFNPVTKEIEVEGSEGFVKAYFNKLQAMISGASEETVTIKRKPRAVKAAPKKKVIKAPKAVKAAPAEKAEKKPPVVKAPRVRKAKKAPKAVKPTVAKSVRKTVKKAPAKKKTTNIDTVVGLIQGAPEGISTAELKTKTGLNERQIWSIVNRASKEGKIRKVKRGVYGGAAASSQK